MKWCLAIAVLFLAGRTAAYDFDPSFWQRLVVTEVMVSPNGILAHGGQWIEVRNQSEEPFNLQGLALATLRGAFHVVSPSKPLIAEPDDILVLAPFWDTATLPKGCVDYAYGGDFWLDTTEDILLILKAGKLLDVFAYGPDSIPMKPGASFSLEYAESGVTKEWCYGRDVYDMDGNLGSPGQANPDCDWDRDGFAEDQGDCDDRDPSVNPGTVEVCNGIDDDCDGVLDDDVGPAPGPCLALGVCTGTGPMCVGVAGWVCTYPETYEVDEISCDGLDNDCDGETDEDLISRETCLSGGVCSGTGPMCAGVAGWVCPYPETYEVDEISCDGLDNDCDGETDEGFDVGNPCVVGVGACQRTGVRVCAPDHASAMCDVQPAAPIVELCGDGIDNDCDGETDEGFAVGEKCVVGTGACRSVGKFRCADDSLSVICGAVPGPAHREQCADGIDNDCDGETDEDDCEAVRGAGNGGCAGSFGPRRVSHLALWLVWLGAALGWAFRVRRLVSSRHFKRIGMW